MLTRLGVPVGFGETKQETWERQHKERMKENKKRKLEAISKTVIEALLKKKLKAPEDDPNHEEYSKPCCKSPRFDIRNNEPAGCIDFPDGSVMEVWRCVACGKIPEHPNAPPIHVFSDSEDEEIYENPFAAFREGAYYF